jgi:hypothetical protein
MKTLGFALNPLREQEINHWKYLGSSFEQIDMSAIMWAEWQHISMAQHFSPGQ